MAVALTGVGLGVACGGAGAPEPATAPPAQPEPAVPEPDVPEPGESNDPSWATMSFEQRSALMRERVLPEMRGLFQAFDAEEFGTFTCATCHGADFQDVRFRMPNGLHPLVPSAIPTLAESDDEEIARAARFMGGEVVPGMVGILGVEPYDPATGQGFGCLSCHATADTAAATD